MTIPESQLESWSHQGAVTQSATTYQTIRNALNDSGSPFYDKSFTIFLQGSYGNDTNVIRDSDVDIVIRLNDTYYANTDALGLGQKANYDKVFSAATYDYAAFKDHVVSWLRTKYGTAVTVGKKAISIKGSGSRRDADVLVCTKHRRYLRGSSGDDDQYIEGISFFRSDTGRRIDNFPSQHSENCTVKHQATNSRFKPAVRVFKNIRNRMVEEGVISDGLAPSYFIEGMLWNVPPSSFSTILSNTFVNALSWVSNADKIQLTCASGLHWLLGAGQEVCWPEADFNAYVVAVNRYWTNWK